MTTEIMMTNKQFMALREKHQGLPVNISVLIRDIEQAVLQSPEIQALREDAAMLDWLDATNTPFKMGWNVRLAPAGNVSVSSVIQLGGSVTPIRAAISASMEQQK